jgi:hypothetical protein
VSDPSGSDDLALAPEVARRIDKVCNRFEAVWRSGGRPRIEDPLTGWEGEPRAALLRELVLLDLDYRRAVGETPAPADYQSPFPELDADWLAKVLLPIPPAVTPSLSQTVQEGPAPGLPRHVGDYADAGPAAGARCRMSTSSESDKPSPLPPTVSVATTPAGARYLILRPHDKGGIGEVFVALDQELNRQVALKEIQERHAADAHSRGRFVREAEITGGLEHPGIVPVYGLGHALHPGRNAQGRHRPLSPD